MSSYLSERHCRAMNTFSIQRSRTVHCDPDAGGGQRADEGGAGER
jgi:hypothetical protein